MKAMIIYKSKLIISNVLKERPFFIAATQDFLTRRRFSSKEPSKVFDSAPILESIFETSVKPYINKTEIHLLDSFLKPYRNRKSIYNFVIDEAVAQDIVEKISANTNIKNSYIVEGNPGLGLITLNLINSGGSHLCVCDNSKLQSLSLKKILQNHLGQIKLRKCNINLSLNSEILSFIAEAQNNNETVTLIGVTSGFYILRILVNTCIQYNLWTTPFEIYLVVSSLAWKSMKRLDPYNFKFVYFCGFNHLFAVQKLASYPSSAFLPLLKTDEGDFVLVRIKMKQKMFKYLKEKDLMDYINFVTVLGRSAYNLIIPTLEKWLPGCGPYLISKGISMSNQTKDLSYCDSITLFKLLKEYEGYEEFRNILRTI